MVAGIPVSRFDVTHVYTMTDRRSDSIKNALKLNNGENFNPDEATDVQRAEVRNAITHMGIVDRFLDWAFDRGRKAEALNNLADMLTHERPESRTKAFMWLLSNSTPEGLREVLPSDFEYSEILFFSKGILSGCRIRLSPSMGEKYFIMAFIDKIDGNFTDAYNCFLGAGESYMKDYSFKEAADAFLNAGKILYYKFDNKDNEAADAFLNAKNCLLYAFKAGANVPQKDIDLCSCFYNSAREEAQFNINDSHLTELK